MDYETSVVIRDYHLDPDLDVKMNLKWNFDPK